MLRLIISSVELESMAQTKLQPNVQVMQDTYHNVVGLSKAYQADLRTHPPDCWPVSHFEQECMADRRSTFNKIHIAPSLVLGPSA